MSHINTDIPELQGYDSGTVLQNLSSLAARQMGLDEIRIAYLCELADAICNDCDNDKDTAESILTSLRSAISADDNADGELLRLTQHLDLLERLYIYRRISGRLWRDGSFFTLPTSDSPLPSDAVGRIAYMKSNLASKAYLKLSAHINGCRATEFYSFEDACAEVVNGQCEYCLLPIESSEAGKLHSFLRLLEKYRLKIAAVCDIPVRSGVDSPTTRFALLRRNMSGQTVGGELGCINSISDLFFEDRRENYRIELIHRPESGSTSPLTELLIAAEFCSISTLRVDTSVHSLSEGDSGIYTVFGVGGGDVITFLWYVSLEAPSDTVMGIYPEIGDPAD
ncbi:MAG: hypothetical protein IJX74_06890 [Clostridia bacterium]|nr:hypothetical protein [Clostridia bacterium]